MYIQADVLEEEAKDKLSQRKSFFPLKIKHKKLTLKTIELVYLPFYVFEVILSGEEGEQNVRVSLDGLLGNTLFFVEKNLSSKENIRNLVCPFILTQPEAAEKVLKDYKGLLLEYGLQARKTFTVERISEAREMYYPFWIGYIQKGKGIDFRAIDGVTGELQGIKMRKVLLRAFRELAQE